MRSPDSPLASVPLGPDRRPPRRAVAVALLALAALAVPAALAIARARPTRGTAAGAAVEAAHNATLGATIVVDAHGRTLYALSGETVHHLKCTSAQCLSFWPPLTVTAGRRVLRGGTGVHGRLGELRRADGVEQVTLRGLPLYRFALDKAAGSAAGQSIASFGGVWHAVTAAATGPGVVTVTPPGTSSTTTSASAAPVAPGTSSSVTSVGYASPSQTSNSLTSAASTTTSISTAATSVATSSTCTPYYIGTYYYPCP